MIKTQKEQLAETKALTMGQEIERDKLRIREYLNRATQATKQLGENNPIAKQEMQSANVFKRALLLVSCGDLTLHNNGVSKNAIENGLPSSAYLSHGARVMVQIPPGSGNSLINWLTSGHEDKDGKSMKQSQQEAIKENKVVYNRSAATHDVAIKKNAQTGEYELKEKKGFFIGAADFIGDKFGKETKHFGVDLAMNASFGGKDPDGKIIDRPDGDHGHLYIHYTAPEEGKPGALLIGMEGAAPSSKKHSKTGASDPLSAVNTSMWQDLEKKTRDSSYQKTLIPQKYNGMFIELNTTQLKDIVQIDGQKFGPELSEVMPCKNANEFMIKVANKEFHQTPHNLQGFKQQEIAELATRAPEQQQKNIEQQEAQSHRNAQEINPKLIKQVQHEISMDDLLKNADKQLKENKMVQKVGQTNKPQRAGMRF